jgi:hypothetical protein
VAHRGRKNADEALVLALACGATVEQAALKAGISARTAHRRLADPAFAGRVQAARGDMTQRASGLLTAALVESIRVLLELQRPTNPPSVRLGATRTLMEMDLKVREAVDFEGRLAALEQRLDAERKGRRCGRAGDRRGEGRGE